MADQTSLVEKHKSSSGRNWTEEEKDLVWDEAEKAKSEGVPLTEAFRQVSRMLPHRSEAAIAMLYYNVLRKERSDEETEKTTPDQISNKPEVPAKTKSSSIRHQGSKGNLTVDGELIEAFQGLPEYIHQLHQRMERIEKQAAEPSVESIAKALLHLADGYQRSDSLQDEVNRLKQRIQQLEETNDQLQNSLQKMEQAYQDAVSIYDLFTNMASISQIMSLGDFKEQMKTTLDKWGNVLDASYDKAD